MRFELKTIVAIILFLISLDFYLLSGFIIKEGFYHDAFLHLATELIILFIASLFVEPVLDAYHDQKIEADWKGGKETAIKDLQNLTIKLGTYLLAPLGIPPTPIKIQNPKSVIEEVKTYTQSEVMKLDVQTIEKLLNQMTHEQWKHLVMNDLLLRKEIEDNVMVYKDIMPREFMSSLLKTRSDFNAFDNFLGLISASYISKGQVWPKSNQGVYKDRGILNEFIREISILMAPVFKNTIELQKQIEKYK